jgi:hypothetical protein
MVQVESSRGHKREAEVQGSTSARRSKTPGRVADVSVHDMLLRARGIPVGPVA